MNANEKLWAIEQIRQVKAKFFRYLDTLEWDQWGELFCEDVELVREAPASNDELGGGPLGRAGLVKARSAMAIEGSRHFGHMPEIELIDDKTARGVWSMAAYDRLPDGSLRRSFGWYHDEFRLCDDGEWRISKLGLRGIIQM